MSSTAEGCELSESLTLHSLLNPRDSAGSISWRVAVPFAATLIALTLEGECPGKYATRITICVLHFPLLLPLPLLLLLRMTCKRCIMNVIIKSR